MNIVSPSRFVPLLLLLIVGCAALPQRDRPQPAAKPPPAAAPAPVSGGLVVRGDGEAELRRRRQTLAAGGQGLQADAVGYYMDVQQARIKQLGSAALVLVRRGDSLVLTLPGVSFEVGSARLAGDSTALLSRLAKVLVEYRHTLVSVHGHTDDTGSAAGNQALSEQRAVAVARQLAGAGVANARLVAIGHGASRPLVANADAATRERNRRVELRIDPLVR